MKIDTNVTFHHIQIHIIFRNNQSFRATAVIFKIICLALLNTYLVYCFVKGNGPFHPMGWCYNYSLVVGFELWALSTVYNIQMSHDSGYFILKGQIVIININFSHIYTQSISL